MDSIDLSEIIAYVTKIQPPDVSDLSLDLNNDGNVNIHDLLTLLKYNKSRLEIQHNIPDIQKDTKFTLIPQINIELENGLYFIHVDWCGWCRKALPEMIKLKNKYPSLVTLHNVTTNSYNNQLLKHNFKLTHYPHLVVVKDNLKYKYSGPRTSTSIDNAFQQYQITSP
mgnify:CR=1 FL=1